MEIQNVPLPNYQLSQLPNLFWFFEICILKDIGRGANQAEAHLGGAGVASREGVAVEHYNFVSATVRAIVDDLINPGFAYSFTGAEERTGTGALFVRRMQPRFPAPFSVGQSAGYRHLPEGDCLILSQHGHHIFIRANNKPICIAPSWTMTQLFF